MVLDADPLRILMAPSGVDKGRVDTDQLIEVDGKGLVVAGQGQASAETSLHLMLIHEMHAGSVLHTHSVTATVLSRHHAATHSVNIAGLEMLKGLRGITSHESSIAIPILANDQNIERLSEAGRMVLKNAPFSLLVEGHGLYTWGASLEEARRHTEITEFLLDVHWRELLLQSKR